MSKFKKFIVGFDPHGDKQHKRTNDVFFRFIDHWKPDIRIAGGDVWDFAPLRRKATEDEKRESMAADYVAGVNWLLRFQPTYFIRGNHDERLWELAAMDKGIQSDYALSGVAEITAMMKTMGCKMLPYHKRDGVLKIGHLKILHGFFCGVYAARQHALVYGGCLFGHIHTIDEHAIPGLERRVARACGALCELDMEYNSRQPNTLRQAHGFAYGIVNERTGAYHVWQAEEVDKRWILPNDTIEL